METLVNMIDQVLSQAHKKVYKRHKHFYIYLDGKLYKSFSDSFLRRNHLESCKFYKLSKGAKVSIGDNKYARI